MSLKSGDVLVMRANRFVRLGRFTIIGLLLLQAAAQGSELADVKVSVIRTPDGGLQPQTAVDASGTLHLIYFKGDPKAGDIFYARRKAGEMEFSKALRV